MFAKAIAGMDQVFHGAVEPGKVILVRGEPGTLKSGLCFAALARLVEGGDSYAVYLTLEQDRDSHMDNMASLGLTLPARLIISDFTQMRREVQPERGEIDILDAILSLVRRFQVQGQKLAGFALDSLNALYALMPRDSDLRLRMFDFFAELRTMRVYALVIKESGPSAADGLGYGGESFLTDGSILLGTLERQGDVMRYLQVVKMRGVQHSLKKHQLIVTERGPAVAGPVYE